MTSYTQKIFWYSRFLLILFLPSHCVLFLTAILLFMFWWNSLFFQTFSVRRVVIYTVLQRKTSLPSWPLAFTLTFFMAGFMTTKHLNLNSILLRNECCSRRSYTLEIKLSQYARYSQKSTKYRLLLAWCHCTMLSKTIISWSNHMTSLFINHL